LRLSASMSGVTLSQSFVARTYVAKRAAMKPYPRRRCRRSNREAPSRWSRPGPNAFRSQTTLVRK
jgi:hypothetical protein